jgi:hypothetical protein
MPGTSINNVLIIHEIVNGRALPLKKDGKNCPPGEDKTGDWLKEAQE